MNHLSSATQSERPSMALIICSNCKEPFDSDQQIVNAKGEAFHTYCFV